MELDDLRERVEGMLTVRPAETTREMTWIVAELESVREILLALIDHLASQE